MIIEQIEEIDKIEGLRLIAMGNVMDELRRRILRDIQVELSEEFDRNFERQGFFSESWQRSRRSSDSSGSTLIDTGGLRRSVRSRVHGDGVEFWSDRPYAGIHNEGGEIVVTGRMKRFFWARYYEAQGGLGRKKDGSLRNTKKNRRLSGAAEFWHQMALKKVGSKIVIPRRMFLGWSDVVKKIVERVIDEDFEDLRF